MFRRKTDTTADRIAGVLLGGAVGDALGVPYEFATPPNSFEDPVMKGGGLGNYEPGEWSDDTQMACCITEAVADGADLSDPATLTRIANRFLDWLNSPPGDIGNQTRSVLRQARDLKFRNGSVSADDLYLISQTYADKYPHSAGNGALMRTGPVALAHLHDRDTAAKAARLVARLTHADPLAGDSCVLWVEAIRVAVTEEHLDYSAGLDLIPDDRVAQWADWINAAMNPQPGPIHGAEFNPNGYTVTALQAAIAAIHNTPVVNPGQHLVAALYNAVRIGNDTDTVATIAGALLGARWGASAIPRTWVRQVHGWPGLDATALTRMSQTIAEHQPE